MSEPGTVAGAPAVAPLRALLVDPSLFTGPYDGALTEGLVAAGVEPVWAVRPTRKGDRQEIDVARVDPFFWLNPARSCNAHPTSMVIE